MTEAVPPSCFSDFNHAIQHLGIALEGYARAVIDDPAAVHDDGAR